MIKEKDIWRKITIAIESALPESDTKSWFSHTYLVQLDRDLALIEVPNKYFANWLRDNYLTRIQDSFKNYLHFLPEIRFTYAGLSGYPKTRQSKNDSTTATPPISGVNPFYTFENFVLSDENTFAYASAIEVSKRPAQNYNPLYIFSKRSLGKTHLLHAVGNHIAATNPLIVVRYVSIEKFSKDLSNALKNKKLNKFRESYAELDFLLFDDFQLLEGREKSQQEFTHLFNTFYQAKKQIVVAGKKSPGQVKDLLPQLRSRMEGGLLLEPGVYDQKTRMIIIQKKAQHEDLHLPDDAAFFLANSSNNLKTLIQHLVSLQTYTSLYQRKIDISTVKSIIKNKRTHNKSVDEIQKLTAEYFNISLSDLLSNKKRRDFSYPRQIAMYLSRKLTDLSFKEIGVLFGNKDHSSVIYAVKRIKNEKNKTTLDDIHKLQKFLL